MEPIQLNEAQEKLAQWIDQTAYIHLETTNGAYASHFNNQGINVGAYIGNAQVKIKQAKIVGTGPSYRAGVKTGLGWIYAEGLTDWAILDGDKLLFAGHDPEGRLMVAFQLSAHPFDNYRNVTTILTQGDINGETCCCYLCAS